MKIGNLSIDLSRFDTFRVCYGDWTFDAGDVVRIRKPDADDGDLFMVLAGQDFFLMSLDTGTRYTSEWGLLKDYMDPDGYTTVDLFSI